MEIDLKGISPDALAALLPRGGRVLVSGCSTESAVMAEAIGRTGGALAGITFTGIFVPGLNRQSYLPDAQARVETFFLTPELKAAGVQVRFLPLCYDDIRRYLQDNPIDAAVMMVGPPDDAGVCSFGPAVDFLAELWPAIPTRLAHINPLMPRTRGYPGIPLGEITAYTVCPQPLLGSADPGTDAVTEAIAGHVAALVPDGATLQTGLGKVPGAVLRALSGRRGLRIHSGLIGDAVMDLELAGALAAGAAVTAGVAIGTERLYAAISRPTYRFEPVCVTHDPTTIASIGNFIAINSANDVDLLGQAYAELGPNGLISGPGGASDFARGVRVGRGLRIVALAATAARGTISRIVAPGRAAGPVSLGRMDIDLVVTEFGVADLRARGYAERAEALIAIAAPQHRACLQGQWLEYARKL
jgi:acyl-CoA hydrolase